MGHDERRYSRAGSFWPERWMEKGREIESFDPYSFPVFQGGPRICLGKDLAMYEVKILLVEFLQRFRIEMPSNTSPENFEEFQKDVSLLNGETIYQTGISLSWKGPLRLSIYRR